MAETVVLGWRLPRALAALILGAGLGVAGAIFQSITRNPLGSPDVVGFTAGAHTGAILAIIFVGTATRATAAGALIGGIASGFVVYGLAYRSGIQGFRLIVVGIAVSASLTALNTWLLMTAELEVALTAAFWGAGSLYGITWHNVIPGNGNRGSASASDGDAGAHVVHDGNER